jgi:hypothetical protein
MGAVMKSPIVTFEELDREKRLDRARDAERLRNGETTPEALQEENSIFPTDAVITPSGHPIGSSSAWADALRPSLHAHRGPICV